MDVPESVVDEARAEYAALMATGHYQQWEALLIVKVGLASMAQEAWNMLRVDLGLPYVFPEEV